jgi:hypothetical protein
VVRLGGIDLGTAVALDRKDIEAGLHARAVLGPIGGGEIAQDAVPNAVAVGLHLDGLGDHEIAVALHVDVADDARDALACTRAHKRQGRSRVPQE